MKHIYKMDLLYTIVLLATLMGSQIRQVEAQTQCAEQRFCSECITAHHECAWCNDVEFTDTRCAMNTSILTSKGCQEIKSPTNNETKTQDKPVQDGGENVEPVQLQPQKVKLTLRPKLTHEMTLKYKVAKNIPLDMYFVLDFSTTMKHQLSTLANLSKELIEGLKRFTENIQIGFGSFLDKTLQPFTITTPEFLKNPCYGIADETCEAPYGFIHHRKLDRDIDQFTALLHSGNTSANFDPMEGGLDALIQAAVCPDIIGWRSQSRRVIIYISDSGFHFAGDAKLAGIDLPNDGHCHMVSAEAGTFIYDYSNKMDYPSFGLLAKALTDNRINTFFVVSDLEKHIYKALTDMIEQAETVTMDTAGATSIVKLITDYYSDLNRQVKLTAENLPDEIEVKVETSCLHSSLVNTYDLREGVVCRNLNDGDTVLFNLRMTLKTCTADKNWKKTFKVVLAGLQESLEVDVTYKCDCNCEQSEELDQGKCSQGNGTYECGVCKCRPGRSGEFCQCDNKEGDTVQQEAKCRKDNGTKVCEDQGTCKCGQCVCLRNYLGPYCECNNNMCIKPGSTEKCSNQGQCTCGRCLCKDDYDGQHCECPPKRNCKHPETGMECNGHGTCNCGKCECEPDYEGPTCGECPKCERCSKCRYRDCVKCIVENEKQTAMINETAIPLVCQSSCPNLLVTMVNKFNDSDPCGFIESKECIRNYLVECSNDTVRLNIANQKVCTYPASALFIVLPILAGILGVGLLLIIIWKILTSFYDKIEYARLEHEIQHAKWSKEDNPIYRTPVTTNQNPVYKGGATD